MVSDVRVRRARRDDVAAVQATASAAWHAAYDDLLGADVVDEVLAEWYADAAVEDGVDNDAQDFFVAVREGRVVGFAHVGPHPARSVHRLYRLYVRPDHWRSGTGRHLLASVEQALYDRNVRVYEAEVLADNDVGVSFYESTGFERVDESETDLAGTTLRQYVYRKQV